MMQKDIVFQYICNVANSTKTFIILLTFVSQLCQDLLVGCIFLIFCVQGKWLLKMGHRQILVNVWIDFMHTKWNQFTSTHLSFNTNLIFFVQGTWALKMENRQILVNVWLDFMHTKLNQFTSTHLSFNINLIYVSHGSIVLRFFYLWGAQILKSRFCDLEVDRDPLKITILSVHITIPS